MVCMCTYYFLPPRARSESDASTWLRLERSGGDEWGNVSTEAALVGCISVGSFRDTSCRPSCTCYQVLLAGEPARTQGSVDVDAAHARGSRGDGQRKQQRRAPAWSIPQRSSIVSIVNAFSLSSADRYRRASPPRARSIGKSASIERCNMRERRLAPGIQQTCKLSFSDVACATCTERDI